MPVIHHSVALRDRIAMLALRGVIAMGKDIAIDASGRATYDTMVGRTPEAKGIAYEAATVGGVPGWWCRPTRVEREGVILYHHGGAYVLGSAKAYRHYAGQIAARAGLPVFVADYPLAPEHPFPAAPVAGMTAYRGLADLGHQHVVLAGDSAGGGLSLVLLAKASRDPGLPRPAGAMVASPWTDLALSARSIDTRTKADPMLKRAMLAEAATLVLSDRDRRMPDASPLYGDLADLPPVLIHVGEDEILLDDSLRYAERFAAVGGSIDLHVWARMPHVFCGLVGLLKAAGEALDIAGGFIGRLPRAL